MTCRVSVVVPTCHRPMLLDRCLSALLAQDLAPDAFEVIIVDDAACEATRCQVARWAECAQARGRTVRYVPVAGPTHGPAAARNAGWRSAHGAIVAFTDDDCIPAPNWLRAGLCAMHDDVDGASGKIIVPAPPSPTDYERNAALLASSEFVTANCFYRRQALEAVGGFDERFTLAWREDTDLYLTLLERGARLVCVPDAAVVHPLRPAPWGVSVSQQRKSEFNALLYRKHPVLYRERIQAAPPWHYYAIVVALTVAMATAIAGWWLAALIACAVWALLTARFCARRLRHTSRTLAHIVEMVMTSLVIPPLAIFWRLRGAMRFRVWFL